MTSYLERYQNGDYEAVWIELTALGEGIGQEPLYSDAMAVARATIERVKANVETVYSRLRTLNYRFAQPKQAYTPPPKDIGKRIAKIENLGGRLPLSLRAWYEIVGGVNFMGDHPTLATYAPITPVSAINPQRLAELSQLGAKMSFRFESFVRKNGYDFKDMTARAAFNQLYAADVARLEALSKPPTPPSIVSDPLVVELPPAVKASTDTWDDFLTDGDESGRKACTIAPDRLHKANISGGDAYAIALGSLRADAVVENEAHSITFINYLRLCFRWGGFPGIDGASVPAEIAFLSKDLLPF